MTSTDDRTRDGVVDAYYDLTGNGPGGFDPGRLSSLLAPDLDFEGPVAGHRTGAAPFAAGAAGFARSASGIRMLQQVRSGEEAAAVYDAQLPGGTVRFAEFFRVGGGQIVSLRLLFDPARYRECGGQ